MNTQSPENILNQDIEFEFEQEIHWFLANCHQSAIPHVVNPSYPPENLNDSDPVHCFDSNITAVSQEKTKFKNLNHGDLTKDEASPDFTATLEGIVDDSIAAAIIDGTADSTIRNVSDTFLDRIIQGRFSEAHRQDKATTTSSEESFVEESQSVSASNATSSIAETNANESPVEAALPEGTQDASSIRLQQLYDNALDMLKQAQSDNDILHEELRQSKSLCRQERLSREEDAQVYRQIIKKLKSQREPHQTSEAGDTSYSRTHEDTSNVTQSSQLHALVDRLRVLIQQWSETEVQLESGTSNVAALIHQLRTKIDEPVEATEATTIIETVVDLFSIMFKDIQTSSSLYETMSSELTKTTSKAAEMTLKYQVADQKLRKCLDKKSKIKSELSAQLQKYEEELLALAAKRETVEAENVELRINSEEAKSEIRNLQTISSIMNDTTEQSVAKLKKIITEDATTSAMSDSSSSELSTSTNILRKDTIKQLNIHQQLQILESQVVLYKERHDRERQRLALKIAKLEREKQKLSAEHSEANLKSKKHETNIEHLKATIANLTETIDEKDEALNFAGNELKTMMQALHVRKEAIDSLERTISRLKGDCQRKDKVVKSQKLRVNQLARVKENLESTSTDLAKKFHQLSVSCASKDTMIENLKRKTQLLEADKENKIVTEETENLRKQLASLKKEIPRKNTRISALSSQIETLKQTIASLSSEPEASTTSAQLQNCRAKLAKLNVQLSKSQSDASQYQQMMSEYQQALDSFIKKAGARYDELVSNRLEKLAQNDDDLSEEADRIARMYLDVSFDELKSSVFNKKGPIQGSSTSTTWGNRLAKILQERIIHGQLESLLIDIVEEMTRVSREGAKI